MQRMAATRAAERRADKLGIMAVPFRVGSS
jgi:hypothetical protein